MPFPLLVPLIIGGASLLAGSYGVKKGIDAKSDFDSAKTIGSRAKRRHQEAVTTLEEEKQRTNDGFSKLGERKLHIFSHQIKAMVEAIKRRKKARASMKDFEQSISKLDVPEMERMVVGSLELERGLASGAVSGALMGLGAYGSVGMLATASTGTAIASLTGAAATNATLAWLGGGALSAGGLGMAGGTAVLGGFVAGPAIAITGMVMASKAEEALSKAYEYESEVDQSIAKIDGMKTVLQGLQDNAREMEITLEKLATHFDETLRTDALETDQGFERMLTVGKALKAVLDTPILEADGSAVAHLKRKLDLEIRTAGLAQYQ